MATQEIPRDDWSSFFDMFSRQHDGWLATVEVFSSELGAQEEAHELPLEGVTLDTETVAITLGKTPEDHITHTISEPEHVWIEQTNEGADAALEIESKDDSKVLIRFHSPAPHEFVDGVLPE